MSTEVISVPRPNPADLENLAQEDLLSEWEERMLKQLERLDRKKQDMLELIEKTRSLRQRSGYNLENAPPIRKDEFRGVRAVQALESYLRIRRGFRIPLSRIVKDLVEGGVDPGQPRGSKNDPAGLVAHTLKIAVPNRRDTFGYEPAAVNEKTGAHVIPKGVKDEEILIWLADTADQAKRRRRVK